MPVQMLLLGRDAVTAAPTRSAEAVRDRHVTVAQASCHGTVQRYRRYVVRPSGYRDDEAEMRTTHYYWGMDTRKVPLAVLPDHFRVRQSELGYTVYRTATTAPEYHHPMITEDRDVRACGPSDRAAAHHWQPLSPGPA
eukprot:3538460-Rhodomonas_salina.2